MKNVCVIGLGYIGLPTASLFANNGVRVIGVDASQRVAELIRSGKSHIEEVGLRTLVEAAVTSGRLSVSPAPVPADAYIICVPTPFKEEKQPDLRHVFDATEALAPALSAGNLVVVESTVPARTTEEVAGRVARLRPDLVRNGKLEVHFAHCPERVLPGQILKELVENDRVIGGLDETGTRLALELYSTIVSGKIFTTDATTAEMVKLAENTYRDVNIAYANELAIICEREGINVHDVIAMANRHPRVRILQPGPGVGGHCIAVDPWFIVARQPEVSKLIRTARERNDGMPHRVIDQALEMVGKDDRPMLACLGASYKGNVGDPRNSPAIEIYDALRERIGKRGAVTITDDHVVGSSLPLVSVDEAMKDATLLLVLADHDLYRRLDPEKVAGVVKCKRVLDTRNALNHAKWLAAGFEVKVLGNGTMGHA